MCHRKYSSIKSLNQHIKIHDDSKGFKCGVCLKVFDKKSNFVHHYRTHTREKPFACEICDRRFAVKGNLVQHQATHSKIRSFKCSTCPEGRFFKTKDHLNRHMVFHYEPKFSCSHCDHKSYTYFNLKRHEKTHYKK